MTKMRPVQSKWETGLIEVGKNCYGYIQSGGLNISNAGLVIGPDNCVVIDTLYVKPMVEAFKRSIRKVTKNPIGQIVYTHHHADHTLGSNFLPKNIPVIAHRHMRGRMIETGLYLKQYRRVNPEHAAHLTGLKHRYTTHVYDGSMTLHLGGREVELRHFGHGHSKGDTVVYVPSAKVLYSGDCCFNFVTPATFDADIGNWIRTVERMLKAFAFKKIVPGHGPVGDRRALEEMLGYLKLVQREARKRFKAGMSARKAAGDIPLGLYQDWMKPDRIEQAVMKLYNEFRGQRGKVISLDVARGG
jgi:glyoxylase-like metal-dependent hydrolase (beta-lactamase superfamily II)